MWRITTTSTVPSTTFFSIATGNTPAPTSRRAPPEEAQLAKKRHLAAKLAIGEGQRARHRLGLGRLGLYLAKIAHCEVTGVTLSQEQLKISQERAARERACRASRASSSRTTARSEASTIASCRSACSSTGVNHYVTFFRKVRDLLADEGTAVIHTIGRPSRRR